MPGIAQDIATGFEQPLLRFVEDGVTAVSGAVAGPFAAASVLFILIFGILIMFGYVVKPLGDSIWIVFRLGILNFLLSGAAGYTTYVTELFFTQIPDGIGTVLATASAGGGGGTNVDPAALQGGAPFDKLIEEGNELFTQILDSSGTFGLGQKLFAFFVMALVAVAAILMFAIVMYAKIALALVIAIGPIFIALALFESTRPFTQSWVGALMNFTVLQILIYALLGMLVAFVQDYVGDPATGVTALLRGTNVIALMVLSTFAASQLPGIASSLAGSGFAFAQKGLGAGAAVQNKIGGSAAKLAGTGAYKGAEKGYRALTKPRNSVSKG